MTQTNTIQNKEELSEFTNEAQDLAEMLYGKKYDADHRLIKSLAYKLEGYFNERLSKSNSQAHQSGIEEERKRIIKQFKKICVVNNDGDCKYWDIEKLGYSNDERKICGYAKFFPQDVLDEILKK